MADVVGYSRMMGIDEAGTLEALMGHREHLFNPLVAEHHGRVVKVVGDGTLVEFPSALDAVACAVAVQRAAASWRDSGRSGIVLRIGVNLGDVLVEGDDIYGDGVNIAARLEALAEPGGICVAAIVKESVAGRIDVVLRDGGEASAKNIDRPIRIWRWHPESDAGPSGGGSSGSVGTGVGAGPPAGRGVAARPRPEQASIAVLPFDNMSGDPGEDYFSDGIAEDIITDLSKVGGLMVIARNSSFRYRGRSVDIRAVAGDLGVGAVLEGSIRRAGNRVRITAQLIDAATGAHLWADRYDRELTDIFAVQDDVTRRIVDALKVRLTAAEAARLGGGATHSVEAHDLYLRARALLLGSVKDASVFRECVGLLRRAIALDPGYGDAHAALAMAYMHDFQNRWSDTPDQSIRTAMELADMAVAKDPASAYGHYTAAIIAGFLRDFARSEAEIDIALELGPNLALAVNAKGVGEVFAGRAEAGIPYIERAMRLDPGFAQQYLHFLGLAHLLAGHYEAAAAAFRDRIAQVPDTDISRAYLASALGHLGDIEAARRVWAEIGTVNPGYDFEAHVGRLPIRRVCDVDIIRRGLARAGLPG